MPDKASTRLHRVTELFETGRELLLDVQADEPVLLWVAKLNSFQRGDAQRDAQAARARRLAALHDDSDDIQAVRTRLAGMSQDAVVEFLVDSQASDARVQARDDVLAESDWFERRGIVERAAALEVDGNEPTDDERKAVAQINEDFANAVDEATTKRLADIRNELEALEDQELHARYLDTWRDNVATNSLLEAYHRAELYYAIRDCEATKASGGRYDHSRCTHLRLLPNQVAVNELPQELIDRVRRVITVMTMTPAEAGFSDAPASSSASSEQSGNAEDSPPSTPTETQPEPAGT